MVKTPQSHNTVAYPQSLQHLLYEYMGLMPMVEFSAEKNEWDYTSAAPYVFMTLKVTV